MSPLLFLFVKNEEVGLWKLMRVFFRQKTMVAFGFCIRFPLVWYSWKSVIIKYMIYLYDRSDAKVDSHEQLLSFFAYLTTSIYLLYCRFGLSWRRKKADIFVLSKVHIWIFQKEPVKICISLHQLQFVLPLRRFSWHPTPPSQWTRRKDGNPPLKDRGVSTRSVLVRFSCCLPDL